LFPAETVFVPPSGNRAGRRRKKTGSRPGANGLLVSEAGGSVKGFREIRWNREGPAENVGAGENRQKFLEF
jgi:hypothetical protein